LTRLNSRHIRVVRIGMGQPGNPFFDWCDEFTITPHHSALADVERGAGRDAGTQPGMGEPQDGTSYNDRPAHYSPANYSPVDYQPADYQPAGNQASANQVSANQASGSRPSHQPSGDRLRRPSTSPSASLSARPPQRDLAMMLIERFNPFQLGLAALLLIHSVFGSPHYTVQGFLDNTDGVMMFLHNVNLIFHEAGHTLFIFFGQFMHLVGGSLFQILLPAFLCGYFWVTGQRYASAIALWWVGQNFLDVSIYIKDAQIRILPLLGGEASLHDWHFILLDLRLLTKSQLIGNIAFSIGILLYIVAIAAAVRYSQIPVKAIAPSDAP
ncbi:MAG TPA: hypothetical protein V6C88_20735, partial [Chroococcidiopsis sp.]